jgi:hypothetical protein
MKMGCCIAKIGREGRALDHVFDREMPALGKLRADIIG